MYQQPPITRRRRRAVHKQSNITLNYHRLISVLILKILSFKITQSIFKYSSHQIFSEEKCVFEFFTLKISSFIVAAPENNTNCIIILSIC